MKGMARMDPPQRFFSFSEGRKGEPGITVDVTGYLTLMAEDDELLPEVFVRMVPGQVDDVLVAAPDFGTWGFDPHASADRFCCIDAACQFLVRA